MIWFLLLLFWEPFWILVDEKQILPWGGFIHKYTPYQSYPLRMKAIMCLSLPRCERMRMYLSWFKFHSPRPEGEEDPPFPHQLGRTGNPEGLPTLLASGREQEKLNGKIRWSGWNRFHLFCAFTVESSYIRLLGTVFFVQVNIKTITESGCQCKYLSSAILVISCPCPKLYFGIQQKKKKKTLQNACSKMQILAAAATAAEAQGAPTGLHSAEEVCSISHRSTTVGFQCPMYIKKMSR